MILTNIFQSHRILLLEFAVLLGGDTKLLSRAEQPLVQLRMVRRVVVIEEGLVPALDHEVCDVHQGQED